MSHKLSHDFYLQEDVLHLAYTLIGKRLCTSHPGEPLTMGRIVEVEAYRAPEDKASHAYNNRRTKRTETLFSQGGVCYIYLCYGIHTLFNIVTNKKGVPHAILIRALEPLEGVDKMLERRKKKVLDYTLTSGPGTVAQALGLTRELDGTSLLSERVWIEDVRGEEESLEIKQTTRIGVEYAKEYAQKPWRYYLKDNPWVSALKKGKSE